MQLNSCSSFCTLLFAACLSCGFVNGDILRNRTQNLRSKLNVASATHSPHQLAKVEGRQLFASGSVTPLTNHGNYAFVMEFELAGQQLRAVPDTGSFTLLVTSAHCPTSSCPRRAFQPQNSATYTNLETQAILTFGSGTVVTQLAQDQLSFAGLPVKQQKFWEIIAMGDDIRPLWVDAEFDGILGLAWKDSMPVSGETTVMETFGIQSFTVCLAKLDHITGAISQSFIYWGQPGALEAYAKQVNYLAVIGETHWGVKLSNFAVKHMTESEPWKVACWDKPCAALIDTGTSYLTAPDDHFSAMLQSFSQIDSRCVNLDILPDIQFRLGGEGDDGIDIVLPARTYVEKLRVKSTVGHSGHPGEQFEDQCNLKYKPANVFSSQGVPVFILGMPFLFDYVAEYDRSASPPRIGIAKKSFDCPDRLSPGAPALHSLASAVASDADGGLGLRRSEETPDARAVVGIGGAQNAGDKVIIDL